MSTMRQVTTEEFDANPASVRDDAQYEPVAVMENGARKLVIMSDAVFRSLYRGSRSVVKTSELSDEQIKAIADARVPEGLEHLDALLDEDE